MRAPTGDQTFFDTNDEDTPFGEGGEELRFPTLPRLPDDTQMNDLNVNSGPDTHDDNMSHIPEPVAQNVNIVRPQPKQLRR